MKQQVKIGIIITWVVGFLFMFLFVGLCLFTLNKYKSVELPEELEAITVDSAHAITLYGWQKPDKTWRIDMRNYKQ